MKPDSQLATQAIVFSLVATAFTTVYITQPVLPIIENEFGTDARTASLSVSMVIFGIALANLPFGILADRYSIKPVHPCRRNDHSRHEPCLRDDG
jgi:YNFM family putative membrane transporter